MMLWRQPARRQLDGGMARRHIKMAHEKLLELLAFEMVHGQRYDWFD
jgi:hypothetical protein